LRRRQTLGDQVLQIHNCVTSIRAIASNAARANLPGTSIKKVWMKPRANFVILNANAAFSMEDQSGVILHDGHGSFIAVRSIFISHVTSATMAEGYV
jgi:hypothetical protein